LEKGEDKKRGNMKENKKGENREIGKGEVKK
jgi:hypothetical protein